MSKVPSNPEGKVVVYSNPTARATISHSLLVLIKVEVLSSMSLAQVPNVVCVYVKQVVHVPFWTVGQDEVVAQTLVKKRRVVNNKKSICVLLLMLLFGGVRLEEW